MNISLDSKPAFGQIKHTLVSSITTPHVRPLCITPSQASFAFKVIIPLAPNHSVQTVSPTALGASLPRRLLSDSCVDLLADELTVPDAGL